MICARKAPGNMIPGKRRRDAFCRRCTHGLRQHNCRRRELCLRGTSGKVDGRKPEKDKAHLPATECIAEGCSALCPGFRRGQSTMGCPRTLWNAIHHALSFSGCHCNAVSTRLPRFTCCEHKAQCTLECYNAPPGVLNC